MTEVRLLGARHGCDLAVGLLPDLREGLNANLHAGLDYAKRAGARRVLVLAGDLPLLTADDVRQMVNVPSGTVVIAPDRHGRGTNALSLPLPQADEFVFAFGPDSLRRHAQEATRLGLLMTAIHSPGLARDIDEPEDLPDAAALAR